MKHFVVLFSMAALCSVTVNGLPAGAVDVRVTIRNLAATDGVALSPIVIGAHNGSVDLFNDGATASPGVENVAELGSLGLILQSEITTVQPSAVATAAPATTGGFGPGILVPGAEAQIILSLNPVDNRYFSYLSMVVPSNDSFIGNNNPTAVELFDVGGNFVAQNFTLTGGAIWDAGTEVNSLVGPAYIVGASATDSPAENGTVHLATSASADLSAQFGVFIGQQTPPGGIFNTIPAVGTGLVSFSFAVVPEPASLALLGVGVLGLLLRRQPR